MPIDPRAKRLLDMVALGASGATPTVEERRSGFRRLMGLTSARPAVGAIEDLDAPGPGGRPIRLRSYAPAGGVSRRPPGLVYFHGGGMVAGSVDTHDVLCRTLANAANCNLIVVDYRLAPEHPFPAAIEDSIAALNWVADNAEELGIDATRLAVGGDSGGGTLATVVAAMARDAGGPVIALQFLLCPVLDFGEESASRRAYATGHLLDRATMESDLRHYLPPGIARTDPRVSPLRLADLTGLPPAIIHAAEFDPLRDEDEAYARRLAEAGVPVRVTCHAGMIHHFYGLAGMIPAAANALDSIGAELREALSADQPHSRTAPLAIRV